MAYTLFALLDDKARYPTVPPEFATHSGWMFYAFVVALLIWAWTRSESIRRSLLALEDPRTMAVLRIGFGIMTIINFVNLSPYWDLLWSDEGLFDLAYAQEKMGRTALRGWTPEDGFFDPWALANFLWNKPSFLYTHGSPEFVHRHMTLLIGVCALYTFGVASRITGVIAWLLISSVYNRNSLYWEGTDTVYRCFWFILLFARTGHAWSFDNWVRCRWLRRRGRLQDPGAPPDPEGQKQPIYRLIPAWPRYLFMLQLAGLYCSTGWVKTGGVWLKGDALYYALNMDHFYRFEGLTQQVSAIFATNVFRVMTWVTHWWERLFPMVLLGQILRFGLDHRDRSWYRAQHRSWRLWLGRAALIAAYGLLYRGLYEIVPFCIKMVDDKPVNPRAAIAELHLWCGRIIPATIALWVVLGLWPVRLFRGGRSLGRVSQRWPRIRLPELRIDQALIQRWFFGRRVWLTLGFVFHGFLITFMNIGMFPFIMLMTYAAYVSGDEFARIPAWIDARIGRRRGQVATNVAVLARLATPGPSPSAVPVRGRPLPLLVVGALGLAGAYLVVARVNREPWIGTATYAWLATIAAVALIFRFLRPRPLDREHNAAGRPLAYSAAGRSLALLAFTWHSTAVALQLFPPFPIFSTWRSPARSVFGSWLNGTGTSQSWEMFAPNPPRSNTFMKTVVVEQDGTRWDLRNNAFEYRPNPWIINDRMRKMQRRMVGKGKWYLRYWATYQCRQWELRTGNPPQEIEIWALTTRIPMPEVVNIWQPERLKNRKDRSGAITGHAYDPRKLKVTEKLVQTHKCGPDGQLPAVMKERYGLTVSDADQERRQREQERLQRQYDNRHQTWNARSDWGRGEIARQERIERIEKAQRERERERERERAKERESLHSVAGPGDDGDVGDNEEVEE